MCKTTEPGRSDPFRPSSEGLFTASRICLYGLVLVALYVTALAFWRSQGLWLVDARGAPAVTDFFPMWFAGQEALKGSASAAYDIAEMKRILLLAFAEVKRALEFNYPPTFLFILTPLAIIPYPTAILVWIGLTLVLYLAMVYAIIPRPSTIVAALASPLTLWEVITFQNGFLSASLIGAALIFLERRPALAGVFIGLLTYKPHLGLLFPFILLASGRLRAFASAAATATIAAAAACIAFGWASWQGFFYALRHTGHWVLEEGYYGWGVLQSIYALSLSLGASANLAWLLHGLTALTITIAVCFLWTMPNVRYPLKAAAATFGSFALSPYIYGYDLVCLGVGVAFLVQDALATKFLRGEQIALVGIFAASFLLFSVGQPMPFGPFILAALGLVVLRRVRLDDLRYPAKAVHRQSDE